MNFVKKTALALAVLATSSTAVMAESIDVKVIGTITPAACKPTLSGGGTIDYGVIPPSSLKKDAFTILSEKAIDFAITCDAPAKLALAAKSGRGVSAVDKDGLKEIAYVDGVFPPGESATVGLGLVDGKGIGGYSLKLLASSVLLDDQKTDTLQAEGKPAGWGKTTHGVLFDEKSQRYVTWSKPGTKEPLAFKTLSGKLAAQAYINKASELDLTKPVKLDGLTTLELVYL